LTGKEWNESHPAQAESYIEAWTEKQKRNTTDNALLQLIIAQSAGVKINGRQPRLRDFLPEWARPSNEELGMAEVARELAKQKKQNG